MLRVPPFVDRTDRRSPWSRAPWGALLALGAGALIGGCDRHTAPPALAAPAAEVGVVVVKTASVGLQTELPGRVEPFRSANIAARVAGVLQKRLFVEGTEVSAGQLLYQIDPAPFKAADDSAAAGLLKAEATLAQAQDVLKRYTPLAVDGAVSQQALITAQLNVQQGLADVASARANLQTAHLNLGYASVRSPIAGRVSQTQVTEGALVGQGQVTPLTTVQQIDPIYINFTQSADEVLRLQRSLAQGRLKRVPGSQAASVRILLPDGTTYPLHGKLFFSGVTVDSSSGQITLRAEVPNPDRVLQLSSYTAGLAVTSFELDFFGRVASLKEQALAQYLGTEQAHEVARLSLIANVATAWLTVLMDDAQQRLSRDKLRNLEATQQLIQRSVAHGVQTQQALQQAVAQTQAARATLAQSEQQRQTDENALQLLLGGFQLVPLQPWLETTALSSLQFADLAPGLPSTLLQRRPDIAQAEQTLIAANANIGAARAAFFPAISLTAGVGSMSAQLSGLLKTGSQTYTLSPQLTLPLFNAGQTQANLDAAKVSREIAVAQYEKAIQTAFREVADALAGRSAALEQLAAYQAQSQATQAQLTLSSQGWVAGVNSRLDWLSAERTWLDSRQRLLQAQLTRLQNQVALYQAMGGSWQASGEAATASVNGAEPAADL